MKIPYSLRLEEKMIKEVQTLARKSYRSVNQEFEYLIQKSISESNKIDTGKLDDIITSAKKT